MSSLWHDRCSSLCVCDRRQLLLLLLLLLILLLLLLLLLPPPPTLLLLLLLKPLRSRDVTAGPRSAVLECWNLPANAAMPSLARAQHHVLHTVTYVLHSGRRCETAHDCKKIAQHTLTRTSLTSCAGCHSNRTEAVCGTVLCMQCNTVDFHHVPD